METARMQASGFLPGNGREKSIRRMIERSRGDEFRSHRGFGVYQRRKNEFVAGLSAFRDGWFYDTVSFGAAAAFATTLMFQTPQSGSKLLNSTNLTGQGGQLPAGTTLQIFAIRVAISQLTVPADFANIIANVTLEFKVNNVPIYQVTPDFFPAGFGALSYGAAQVGTAPAGTSVMSSTNNGLPVQTAIYEFKNPYQLGSQENFNVVLTPQTAFNLTAATGVNPIGVGTTIRIYLDGLKQSNVTS
jgi:hypothetical protein